MIENRFLVFHNKYDLKEAQCVRQILCKMYLKEAFGIILERDCALCYSVVLQKLLILHWNYNLRETQRD